MNHNAFTLLLLHKKVPLTIFYLCRILHGDEKALFHYVNLRINKGMIYSMDTFYMYTSRHFQSVINQFELAAQQIHTLFAQKVIFFSSL